MRGWEKFNNVIDGVGSLVLILLLLLLLLLSFGIMVNAFLDLRNTNERITITVRQAAADFNKAEKDLNESVTQDVAISRQAYLDKLASSSHSMLDSSTISFLFQLFALALVSAGVYVLSRYHGKLVAIEENARQIIESRQAITEVVEDGIAWSSIGGLLLAGLGVSCALEMATRSSQEMVSRIASIRESIRQVNSAIGRALGSRRAMDVSQRDVFIDQIVTVKNSLKKAGGVDDVEAMCEDCIRLLKRGEFVERHRDRREKLESVWK